MTEKAPINPVVLRWARETAHMSLEQGADKVQKTPEVLEEWETGVSQPTMKQAEALAKAYKRPFAVLFLPDIPRDFMPLQDYRRDQSRAFSTGSVFIIRDVQQKQAWMSDMLQDEGSEPLPFVGAFRVGDPVERVASFILQTLAILPGQYSKPPLQEWIAKAEAAGIFIARTSFLHSRMKLDSDEFKGFAIADRLAPFVFINSDDWDAPQLFTLVHEITHIIIAETGISGDIDLAPEKHRDQYHPVERYCNEVAAVALMPTELVRQLDPRTFESSSAVLAAARQFGVSAFALLVRAYFMGIIPLNVYRALRTTAEADFREYERREADKRAAIKAKPDSGGPNPYFLRTLRNGKLFTQIVLSAFRGGRIQPTEASRLLGTPVNKFPNLESFLLT